VLRIAIDHTSCHFLGVMSDEGTLQVNKKKSSQLQGDPSSTSLTVISVIQMLLMEERESLVRVAASTSTIVTNITRDGDAATVCWGRMWHGVLKRTPSCSGLHRTFEGVLIKVPPTPMHSTKTEFREGDEALVDNASTTTQSRHVGCGSAAGQPSTTHTKRVNAT